MSPLATLLFIVLIYVHTCYAELIASATLTSTSEFDLKIDITVDVASNNVDITYKGSTDNWFGIGFNSTVMDGTYAIVCSGGDSYGDEVTYEYNLNVR